MSSHIDDAAVRAALEGALADIPALPPIYRENIDSAPSVGAPHLRLYLVRAGEKKVGLDYTRADGMFQVNLHTPVGDGPEPGEAIGGAIKGLFEVDGLLSGLVRIEAVEMLSGSPDDTKQWWVTPLQVDWCVDQIG